VTVTDVRPNPTVAKFVDNIRVLTYLSAAICIASSVVFAVLVGDGWSWPLFVWGLASGPLWIAATYGVYRFAGRQVLGATPPPSRFQALYPAWSAMGIPFGVFSASIGSPAPDLGLTVYAFFATILPLAFVPRLRRRQAAHSKASSCPFQGACGSACVHQGEGCP
jgi:hypothetical protein